VSTGWRPERADVVALLAQFGDRDPVDVPERIDSLELAWLVHQVEQRRGVVLDLSDDDLTGMDTVTSAVEALRRAMNAGDGHA
jgi:hypothetical protein